MARDLCLVFFLFLASGCATVSGLLKSSDKEASQQTVETLPPAVSAPEKQSDLASGESPASMDSIGESSDREGSAARKTPTKEEIRQAQRLVRASGISPGPIDGVLGPKTRAAFLKFHSKCATVSDLLEGKDPAGEGIREAQRLLKTSGFDPGPIDGIPGVKTEAAHKEYQAACAMLGDLLETPVEEVAQQTTQSQAPTASAYEKGGEIGDENLSNSAERDGDGSGKDLANQNGSREEIRQVQERLKTAGFNPGPIDGILGPQTREALQRELRAKYEY